MFKSTYRVCVCVKALAYSVTNTLENTLLPVF